MVRKKEKGNEMRVTHKTLRLLAAAALFLGMGTGSASAQNLDLDEVGALLALPIVTGTGPTVTGIVVTNAGPATTLHINVLSGDPGDNWFAQDFDCNVTANETVLFVFDWDGYDGSLASYECTNFLNGQAVETFDDPFEAREGIFVVTLKDPSSGDSINSNQIFGDATVIDFGAGAAYSVGAIPFQGVLPDGGVGDNEFRFDNVEYTRWPSALATNFIAATPYISLELILFTLDGTAGQIQTPNAFVNIDFYNDDEVRKSTEKEFDCFIILDLPALDGRFYASALGSYAGHMVIKPEGVTYNNLAHDTSFDGGPGSVPGVRVVPVHGWIVQSISEGGDLAELGLWNNNQAAWARTLAQSQLPLVVSSGDTPVFKGK
jgi:hypothetical protein